MKNIIRTGIVIMLFMVGAAGNVNADLFGGVDFPGGISSFADSVFSYTVGSAVDTSDGSEYSDPTNALGAPQLGVTLGDYVSLGWGGELILQFTDNYLTTSGDNGDDLMIFESGVRETTNVDISTNGTDWINVGSAYGSAGIDIDAYIGSGVILSQQYSFVRLKDPNAKETGSPYGGADIDAVGAITSAAPVPEPATILLFGTGIAGLAISRFRKKRN